MRVVFDTNVVVSAALRNRAPEEVIRFVVGHAEFEWIASRPIVQEYVEVLSRPRFALPADVLSEWKRMFDEMVTIIEVQAIVSFPRDPMDAMFLACAIEGHAQFIVTGDRDFEDARRIEGFTILSVSQFKSAICDRWPR